MRVTIVKYDGKIMSEKIHKIEANHISKTFPGVKALVDVSVYLNKGELLSIVGENGAGKSTLMKILAGVYTKDEGLGEIYIDGNLVDIRIPRDALDHGISIIHQELSVAPDITVAENIYMGREPLKNGVFIDRKKLIADTRAVLKEIDAPFKATDYPRTLSIAEQQVLEIAKAISQKSDVIIMDEPTASLSETEMEHLFALIGRLKAKGISIIYISHRLKEVVELSDRVVVLRDGEHVATMEKEEINEKDMVAHMVGRDLTEYYGELDLKPSDEKVLTVKNLADGHFVNNVSFDLCKGEILGLAGLVGAGRSEIAKLIFGVDKKISGEVYLNGKEIDGSDPINSISNGISYLTEDRKGLGLFLDMSSADNISLNVLNQISRKGFLKGNSSRRFSRDYIKNLNIKVASPSTSARSLSGGNQQKLLISRMISTSPKVLILDEPTRGVDVGAKSEIYKIIERLVESGEMSVVVISSELPEIIGLATRVLVVRDGTIVHQIKDKESITQENIMAYAAGMKSPDYEYEDDLSKV